MLLRGKLRIKRLTGWILLAIFCLQLGMPGANSMALLEKNPLLATQLFDQVVPFDQLAVEDYLPAIKAQLAEQQKIVETIKAQTAAPTFCQYHRPAVCPRAADGPRF